MSAHEELEIWAPHAREVALWYAGAVHRARPVEHGYYRVPAPPVATDYFVLLDGKVRPDPRSPWQPQGVHGPSQRVARDFVWHDEAFRPQPLASGVIYELHIGTFTPTGTYAAAAERLPYLAQLGVTHVELMPIAAFPGARGWGYDGVHLWAPHPAYGTPRELEQFVARAHALGLGVLLDVVYNHLGPDGNCLADFGPYFTDRHRTPWGRALNLDGPGSDEVKRHFVDNACMWLRDYHFDGLRLDAVHALFDTSATHFLEQLAREVHALGECCSRELCVIAESDLNDPRMVRSVAQGGYGLDAQWSDDLHHALHAVLTGERAGYYADFGALDDVAAALRDGYVYAGRRSQHRERTHGRPLGDTSGTRLLGYLQTHDQVGNRARGERISALTTPGCVCIGAALAFVAPSVPMLFAGEEWGASTPFLYFTDHQDSELAEAVREGRRNELSAFGWNPQDVPDPQAESTFLASVLRWEEQGSEPHASIAAFYRALIALRRTTPDLLDGRRDRVRVQLDESARWIAVQRGAVTLHANLGAEPVRLERPPGQCVLAYPATLEPTAPLPPGTCTLWLAQISKAP